MAVLQSLLVLLMVFTMGNAGDGAVQENHSRCPRGWKGLGSKCYKYFSQTVTWRQAETNCQDLGGHLASVSDKSENDFLLSLVPTSTRCWIGASDCVEFGWWLWNDGSSSQYTNFCSGEPNNLGGVEHCLEINFTDNHCWNDSNCSGTMSYICTNDQ